MKFTYFCNKPIEFDYRGRPTIYCDCRNEVDFPDTDESGLPSLPRPVRMETYACVECGNSLTVRDYGHLDGIKNVKKAKLPTKRNTL